MHVPVLEMEREVLDSKIQIVYFRNGRNGENVVRSKAAKPK